MPSSSENQHSAAASLANASGQADLWLQNDGHTKRGRVGLLVALAGGHAVKHVFVAGMFVLLPELKASLGLTNTGLGTLAMARSLAGGVANVPAGFVADRYQRHFSPMLVGILVFAAIFQLSLSRSVGLLDATIYSSVLAILFTAWHPPAIAVLSMAFSDRRGLAVSMHGAGASVGEALGPLLAGALLIVMSWQAVLQVAAVPALVAAAVIWLLTRNYKMQSIQTSVGDYVRSAGQLLTNRQLLGLLAVAGLYGGAVASMFVFLPIYIREELGRSPLTVGLWISMAQGVGIVTQPAMGYLLDKVGRRAVISPALFMLAAAIFFMYLTGQGPLFLVALAVAGAFLFSVTALLVAAALDIVGDRIQATTVSLVYVASTLFTGLGPLLAGVIADMYSPRVVFVYSGILALAAAILASRVRMRPAPSV